MKTYKFILNHNITTLSILFPNTTITTPSYTHLQIPYQHHTFPPHPQIHNTLNNYPIHILLINSQNNLSLPIQFTSPLYNPNSDTIFYQLLNLSSNPLYNPNLPTYTQNNNITLHFPNNTTPTFYTNNPNLPYTINPQTQLTQY